MTLQSSGAISLANINTELGRSSTATISLGETAVRNLAGVASGAISLSNLYGKSNVSFSPAGANSAPGTTLGSYASGGNDASVTITCTQTATWTWNRTGDPDGYANISSGGTGTTITFTLPNYGFSPLYTSFSVTGSASGTTKYWTVNLQNNGFA